jgi:hypothetical protein
MTVTCVHTFGPSTREARCCDTARPRPGRRVEGFGLGGVRPLANRPGEVSPKLRYRLDYRHALKTHRLTSPRHDATSSPRNGREDCNK